MRTGIVAHGAEGSVGVRGGGGFHRGAGTRGRFSKAVETIRGLRREARWFVTGIRVVMVVKRWLSWRGRGGLITSTHGRERGGGRSMPGCIFQLHLAMPLKKTFDLGDKSKKGMILQWSIRRNAPNTECNM